MYIMYNILHIHSHAHSHSGFKVHSGHREVDSWK